MRTSPKAVMGVRTPPLWGKIAPSKASARAHSEIITEITANEWLLIIMDVDGTYQMTGSIRGHPGREKYFSR